MFKRIISSLVILCFICTSVSPQAKAADGVLNLPVPGTMVNLSPAYQPALIKGLTIHKDNPFLFDFIVDTGNDMSLRGGGADAAISLKKEGDRLVKYFFACLTIPEKDLWVNLSPYEKDRMIPNALGKTALGRDLLAQDYILKQLTASLIYPEKNLGKEFWDRVYTKAQQMYGTSQIPVNTFNKVWILADRADVYENNQTAFVLDGHLKVMLDEDYLALQRHSERARSATEESKGALRAHSIASQIVRSIILPEIEKEVNTGRNFATLRQIYNSMILASWYKQNLKEALLNQVYADKSTVKGVNLADPSIQEKIYQQYIKAYKKGVFNYIKEDAQADGQMVPKKYFSGGFGVVANPVRLVTRAAMLASPRFTQAMSSSGKIFIVATTLFLNGSLPLTSETNNVSTPSTHITRSTFTRNIYLKRAQQPRLSNSARFRDLSDLGQAMVEYLYHSAPDGERSKMQSEFRIPPADIRKFDADATNASKINQEKAMLSVIDMQQIMSIAFQVGPRLTYTIGMYLLGRAIADSRKSLDEAKGILDTVKASTDEETFKPKIDRMIEIFEKMDSDKRFKFGPGIMLASILGFSHQVPNSQALSDAFLTLLGSMMTGGGTGYSPWVKNMIAAAKAVRDAKPGIDRGLKLVDLRALVNFEGNTPRKAMYHGQVLMYAAFALFGMVPNAPAIFNWDGLDHLLRSSNVFLQWGISGISLGVGLGLGKGSSKFEQWRQTKNSPTKGLKSFRIFNSAMKVVLGQRDHSPFFSPTKPGEVIILRRNGDYIGAMQLSSAAHGEYYLLTEEPLRSLAKNGPIPSSIRWILLIENELNRIHNQELYILPFNRLFRFQTADSQNARWEIDLWDRSQPIPPSILAIKSFETMLGGFMNFKHGQGIQDDWSPLFWKRTYGADNPLFNDYENASPADIKKAINEGGFEMAFHFMNELSVVPDQEVLEAFIQAMQNPSTFRYALQYAKELEMSKSIQRKNVEAVPGGKFDPKQFENGDKLVAILWRLFTLWHEKDQRATPAMSGTTENSNQPIVYSRMDELTRMVLSMSYLASPKEDQGLMASHFQIPADVIQGWESSAKNRPTSSTETRAMVSVGHLAEVTTKILGNLYKKDLNPERKTGDSITLWVENENNPWQEPIVWEIARRLVIANNVNLRRMMRVQAYRRGNAIIIKSSREMSSIVGLRHSLKPFLHAWKMQNFADFMTLVPGESAEIRTIMFAGQGDYVSMNYDLSLNVGGKIIGGYKLDSGLWKDGKNLIKSENSLSPIKIKSGRQVIATIARVKDEPAYTIRNAGNTVFKVDLEQTREPTGQSATEAMKAIGTYEEFRGITAVLLRLFNAGRESQLNRQEINEGLNTIRREFNTKFDRPEFRPISSALAALNADNIQDFDLWRKPVKLASDHSLELMWIPDTVKSFVSDPAHGIYVIEEQDTFEDLVKAMMKELDKHIDNMRTLVVGSYNEMLFYATDHTRVEDLKKQIPTQRTGVNIHVHVRTLARKTLELSNIYRRRLVLTQSNNGALKLGKVGNKLVIYDGQKLIFESPTSKANTQAMVTVEQVLQAEHELEGLQAEQVSFRTPQIRLFFDALHGDDQGSRFEAARFLLGKGHVFQPILGTDLRRVINDVFNKSTDPRVKRKAAKNIVENEDFSGEAEAFLKSQSDKGFIGFAAHNGVVTTDDDATYKYPEVAPVLRVMSAELDKEELVPGKTDEVYLYKNIPEHRRILVASLLSSMSVWSFAELDDAGNNAVVRFRRRDLERMHQWLKDALNEVNQSMSVFDRYRPENISVARARDILNAVAGFIQPLTLEDREVLLRFADLREVTADDLSARTLHISDDQLHEAFGSADLHDKEALLLATRLFARYPSRILKSSKNFKEFVYELKRQLVLTAYPPIDILQIYTRDFTLGVEATPELALSVRGLIGKMLVQLNQKDKSGDDIIVLKNVDAKDPAIEPVMDWVENAVPIITHEDWPIMLSYGESNNVVLDPQKMSVKKFRQALVDLDQEMKRTIAAASATPAMMTPEGAKKMALIIKDIDVIKSIVRWAEDHPAGQNFEKLAEYTKQNKLEFAAHLRPWESDDTVVAMALRERYSGDNIEEGESVYMDPDFNVLRITDLNNLKSRNLNRMTQPTIYEFDNPAIKMRYYLVHNYAMKSLNSAAMTAVTEAEAKEIREIIPPQYHHLINKWNEQEAVELLRTDGSFDYQYDVAPADLWEGVWDSPGGPFIRIVLSVRPVSEDPQGERLYRGPIQLFDENNWNISIGHSADPKVDVLSFQTWPQGSSSSKVDFLAKFSIPSGRLRLFQQVMDNDIDWFIPMTEKLIRNPQDKEASDYLRTLIQQRSTSTLHLAQAAMKAIGTYEEFRALLGNLRKLFNAGGEAKLSHQEINARLAKIRSEFKEKFDRPEFEPLSRAIAALNADNNNDFLLWYTTFKLTSDQQLGLMWIPDTVKDFKPDANHGVYVVAQQETFDGLVNGMMSELNKHGREQETLVVGSYDEMLFYATKSTTEAELRSQLKLPRPETHIYVHVITYAPKKLEIVSSFKRRLITTDTINGALKLGKINDKLAIYDVDNLIFKSAAGPATRGNSFTKFMNKPRSARQMAVGALAVSAVGVLAWQGGKVLVHHLAASALDEAAHSSSAVRLHQIIIYGNKDFRVTENAYANPHLSDADKDKAVNSGGREWMEVAKNPALTQVQYVRLFERARESFDVFVFGNLIDNPSVPAALKKQIKDAQEQGQRQMMTSAPFVKIFFQQMTYDGNDGSKIVYRRILGGAEWYRTLTDSTRVYDAPKSPDLPTDVDLTGITNNPGVTRFVRDAKGNWVKTNTPASTQKAMSNIQGGIDFSNSNMAMTVTKDAHGGVQVNFNPALIAEIRAHGVWSAQPFIIRVTPMDPELIRPLLGLGK